MESAGIVGNCRDCYMRIQCERLQVMQFDKRNFMSNSIATLVRESIPGSLGAGVVVQVVSVITILVLTVVPSDHEAV
ncbi:hypothetical protein DBV39_07495 [Orrella marina]|uniref:Uncharacterized protein n=1 Tax=Orrella marina TaxID=2163011 RepID=A0A2R4XIC5_9BURK|nr:hypothetical protein DBV39_07495 [Orrella marina]